MGLDKSQYCLYENVLRDEKYRLIVLDMDGTLYFQRKMQTLMFRDMALYVLKHPDLWWELRAVYVFRRVRENARGRGTDNVTNLLQTNYEQTAQILGKTTEIIKNVIEKWLFEKPLLYIADCRDVKLCRWIKKWQEDGVKVVVYSDYPADNKCDTLRIRPDAVYSSEDEKVGQLKPSKKALEVIGEEFGIGVDEMLVVGDCYSEDGKMAEDAGVDYLIVEKTDSKRNKKWNDFTNFI